MGPGTVGHINRDGVRFRRVRGDERRQAREECRQGVARGDRIGNQLRVGDDAFGKGLDARRASIDLLADLALQMRDGGRVARAEPAELTRRAAGGQDKRERPCGADES